MGREVDILNITRISLPPLPETPLPMKLSLFDAVMIGHAPVHRLLLYPNPTTNIPFPSLLEFLKSSLTKTVLDYLPLAGQLTYVASAGDVEIDFSDPNFTFVEAESELDLHGLAGSEIQDVGSFVKLVPELDFSALPFPVFAVQASKFRCGGVAIGYTVHHAIADGKALFRFSEAWSSTCKAMISGGTDSSSINHREPIIYDRALIKHPKAEEIARQFLRSLAPNLPMIRRLYRPPVEKEHDSLARRTFVLNAPSVQSLKQRATRHDTSNSTSARPPSTFSAISAHVWACIVRSKSFEPDTPTVLAIPMDCRARLNPPIIDQDYFGNCIRPVFATTTAGELIGVDGLVSACTALRVSIDGVPEDPLSDCESWIAELEAKLRERCVFVSASPRFRAYDADFGWGRPGRFELVSMNNDGQFALYAGREEGTVQVSVTLASSQMETFAELFLEGSSGPTC